MKEISVSKLYFNAEERNFLQKGLARNVSNTGLSPLLLKSRAKLVLPDAIPPQTSIRDKAGTGYSPLKSNLGKSRMRLLNSPPVTPRNTGASARGDVRWLIISFSAAAMAAVPRGWPARSWDNGRGPPPPWR